MNCSEIRQKFVDYIDGDLTEDQRLWVELHIAQCYACREELDELGRMLDLCNEVLQHPDPSSGRFDELSKQLRFADVPYHPVTMPRRRRTVGEVVGKLAAAAIILAVVSASPFLIRGAGRLFSAPTDSAALGDAAGVRHLTPFRALVVRWRERIEQEVGEESAADDEEAEEQTVDSRR